VPATAQSLIKNLMNRQTLQKPFIMPNRSLILMNKMLHLFFNGNERAGTGNSK
jgi:hypothetical protein